VWASRCSSAPQQAGTVAHDANLDDILQMVGGIGKNPTTSPDQVEHVLDIALDGLRYRPA
jgi:hypothetical protein